MDEQFLFSRNSSNIKIGRSKFKPIIEFDDEIKFRNISEVNNKLNKLETKICDDFWKNDIPEFYSMNMNQLGRFVNYNYNLILLQDSMKMKNKSLTVSDCKTKLLECENEGIYLKKDLNELGSIVKI